MQASAAAFQMWILKIVMKRLREIIALLSVKTCYGKTIHIHSYVVPHRAYRAAKSYLSDGGEKFHCDYTPRHDSVAQLDRVTDYESVGLGFESLPGHQRSLRTFCAEAFVMGRQYCSPMCVYVYTILFLLYMLRLYDITKDKHRGCDLWLRALPLLRQEGNFPSIRF